MPAPNRKLRLKREAARSAAFPEECMSRGELAEAVNTYLWHTHRKTTTLDADSIARYERGDTLWPNSLYRAAFREVLNASTDSELGFRPTRRGRHARPSSLVSTERRDDRSGKQYSLGYFADLRAALKVVHTLADADTSNALEFDVAEYSTESSLLATLSWIVDETQEADFAAGEPVSQRDVEEIRATTRMVDELDRKFGGDYSRGLAVKYLHSRAAPMLERPCAGLLRRDLFHSASVLCEVIGYMAYDAQLHGLAQRYLLHSLRLAKEAGDESYGAFVLGTISHQAIYLKYPDQALRIAQVARQKSCTGSEMAVLAESAMLEATAYSLMNDRASCAAAIRVADKAFEKYGANPAPYWASHWDDAVYASFVGSCHINLGDTSAARPYLDVLQQKSQGAVRREVFCAGQLAKAAMLERDVEQALHYGLAAAGYAKETRSKRSHRIVHEVAQELRPHTTVVGVQDFLDDVSHSLRQ